MRPILGLRYGLLLTLALGPGAAAQDPPPARQPGTPGAPVGTDLSVPAAERGIGAAPTTAEVRAAQPPPLPPLGTETAPPAIPAPAPAPGFNITLGSRHACVVPSTRNRARADGGIIDVQSPAPGTLTVAMTGTPAADSYLGCTSTACQTFRLVQEFEIACSDPTLREVTLTLDSTLVGYVRSMRKAGACMRLASASVTPAQWDSTPLVLSYPPMCATGTQQGQLCNEHLPQVQGPPMPLGRYTLVADFVLDATAGGICNAHAAADFSPDTALPADWVRSRDPFQGVSKKSFGFNLTLTATAPSGSPPASSRLPGEPSIRRAEYLAPKARILTVSPSPSGTRNRSVPNRAVGGK